MEGKPLLTSRQKTEVVCGVPTQVVCTAFSSHILVVVTQFGKMGTLVSLEPSNAAGDISKPVLTTKVLLGQDEVKRLGRGPVVEGRWRVAVRDTECLVGKACPLPRPPAFSGAFVSMRAPACRGSAFLSPSVFYPVGKWRCWFCNVGHRSVGHSRGAWW